MVRHPYEERNTRMIDGYSLCFNQWALDKRIKNELNLLLMISSLTAKEGYCYASNEYFAKLFDEHPVNISKKIKKLEKLGYIKIEYKRIGYLVTGRKIRLAKMLTAISKNANRTISKNAKYNNTSINNTNKNKGNFEKRNYNDEFLQSFYE